MYRSKFEQLLLTNVVKRSGVSEDHVKIILYFLYNGMYKIMKDPHTHDKSPLAVLKKRIFISKSRWYITV